jgi:hypothetical protein
LVVVLAKRRGNHGVHPELAKRGVIAPGGRANKFKGNAMKRLGILVSAAALVGALAISGPASAFGRGGGFYGGGFHGGGFHGGGFHGGGWRGAGFNGGGWRGGGWNGGYGYGGAGWGVGAGLLGLGLGYGLANGGTYGYPYGYGDPYAGYYGNPGYAYAPGYYTTQPQIATTAPLVTGRSVAAGQIGDSCTTPVRTCQLIQASYVGVGCSCRVTGGRARGSVTP